MEDSINNIKPQFKTNTKWILWYHNPSDKNWTLSSYKDIIELSYIEDFWVLKNTWDKCLPNTSEGMFFLMRKYTDYYILPQWEDKNNVNGGYWSFKIPKENSNEIWFKLTMFLLGEIIMENVDNSLEINGISISPKKHFCIIKIWNNNIINSNMNLLSDKLSFLDIDKGIYTQHANNIKKDSNKQKFMYKKKYNNNKYNNNKYNNNKYNNNNNKYNEIKRLY